MNIITLTPTISTSIYASGDALGGKLTFEGVPFEECVIESITLIDKDKQSIAADLILFDADFTAPSDNAAFTVSSGDEDNILAVVSLSGYTDLGNRSVTAKHNLGIPIKNTGNRKSTLYGQLITRGTPTYTSTSSLIVKIAVRK